LQHSRHGPGDRGPVDELALALEDGRSVMVDENYVRESILDPGAELPEDYRFVRVVTRKGDVVTGKLLNQSTFSIQILDSTEHLRSFERTDLQEVVVATSSQMPSYRNTLDTQEVADLVAYLTTRRGRR
jgi:putative heme-binding domain-containing protein